MKNFLKLTALTATLGMGAMATTASAHDKADSPCAGEITAWADRDAVIAAAAEQGVTAKRIGMRGACFLVMGEDADGERSAVVLKADTLEKVDMPERPERGKRGPGKRGGQGKRGMMHHAPHHGQPAPAPEGATPPPHPAPEAPSTDG